jgi:hypothetical protein
MNFKVLDELPTRCLVTERNIWHGRENTNQQHAERHEGGQESKVGAGRLRPWRNSRRRKPLLKNVNSSLKRLSSA